MSRRVLVAVSAAGNPLFLSTYRYLELAMDDSVTAADFLPQRRSLTSLRRAAQECQGCPLYREATQTVFGHGSAKARLVLIGEQPGDEEDRDGRPFVGPAGRLLDQLLDEAGVPRKEVYVTNAVKHFKFEWRGKRRLHKTPRRVEVVSCRPWLENELGVIEPRVVICLGATAAKSLAGPNFRLTKTRGTMFATPWCEQTMATYHPSALLRMPNRDMARQRRTEVVGDLKYAWEAAS